MTHPTPKAGHLAPETHTSHSFYLLLLLTYSCCVVPKSQPVHETTCPNAISTAAGPHQGSGLDPAPVHSWAHLSSAPGTLLLSLPLPGPGSAPLGGGGHSRGTVLGLPCGHTVPHTGRTGVSSSLGLETDRRCATLLWGLWVIFSGFLPLDLSVVPCACPWRPVWKPTCQATLDRCIHQTLVGGWTFATVRDGAQT